MFDALANRNYRVYFLGAGVSNIGTWLQTTAQAWLVLELTGSGFALGLTLALQLVPALFLSPIAGVVADRWPKRRLMALMQGAMATPAVVLGLLAVSGTVTLLHVYALSLAFGVARAFEAPVRQSFVPELVERHQLANAVALSSASFNAGHLIGPALAGVLIAAFGGGTVGSGWVILLNAVSYLCTLTALALLDGSRMRRAPVSAKGRGAVREGVRYVRSRPDIVLIMVCMAFLGAFGMHYQITTALMATEVFDAGPRGFGLLGTLVAVGSLSGALLAALRSNPQIRHVLFAAVLLCCALLVSSVMPSYHTYALVLPFIGIGLLTMSTTANAYFQLTSDPAMRGRVSALYLMVYFGSAPVGSPLVGWAAEHIGPRWAIAGCALVILSGVLAAVTWFAWSMRRAGRPIDWRRPRRVRTVVGRPGPGA